MSLSDDLFKIAPILIEYDKFNPRGETVDQIINDDEFHKLKASISQIGVLVPLIIQKNNSLESNKEYQLIDGERRLRVAIDLNLQTIPARIVENDVEGKIIAYQIHQNRKAWSKPSEAKSIQSIINSIRSNTPNISDSDLKKKLIEITSHKPNAINDILKILKYSNEIQEKSSIGEIDHSYLIRIEDDFITPLKRAFVEVFESFSENEIREIMVRKAELKLLINTRYMMSSDFKEIFKPNLCHGQILTIIEKFLQSPEKSASDLFNEFREIKTQNEECNELVNSIINDVQNASLNGVGFGNSEKKVGKDETIETSNQTTNIKDKSNGLNTSSQTVSATNPDRNAIIISKIKKSGFNAIKEGLENIAKQYSEEELEYIKEAIVCLGSEKALKASVLMIWASSISKVLKFIEKDIQKFNSVSTIMQQNKKSFYKYYSPTFQKNATTIDEIRELAKDMQLLCYLCYEGIITQSQFKQLKGHYDIRNECAHPTSLILTMNEVLAIFENLMKFIFNNPRLK